MSIFSHNPRFFRISFGILVACAVIFAGYVVIQFGKSPYDENLFKDPPSNAYVTRSIPAQRMEGPDGVDSILAGDLILSLNGKTFPSFHDGLRYFKSLPDSDIVVFALERPSEQQHYVYRLRRAAMAPSDVRELPPTAMVIEVNEGGSSDRAGMRVGDLITRINGETFPNSFGADAILRRGEYGKTLDYEILRDNTLVTLHVTLASYGFQFAFLAFMICGVCYIATGVFLGEARPQFSATRLLGMFFFLVGYLMVVGPANRGLPAGWVTALHRASQAAAVCLAFPVLLHSMHYFPKERPELLRRKWILRGGYTFAIIVLIAVLLSDNQIARALTIALALYVLLVPLPFRKECSTEYKKMNRLVRWTSAAIGAGTILAVLVASGRSGQLALNMLVGLGFLLLSLPAAYLYTIGRFRLYDLALRVRRSVQYSFVSVLWGALVLALLVAALSWLVQEDLRIPYLRITGSSIQVIDTPPSRHEQLLIERTSLVLLVFGTALVLWRIYKTGGRLISQKFYRTRYDYRRAATELSEVMSTTLNMTHLAKGIVEKLASLMQLKRVGLLFFRDQQTCCCHEAHGFDGTSWGEFCTTFDSRLADNLRQFTQAVRVESLPPEMQEMFLAKNFYYLIPIRSKEKMVGTILIGEKMSESSFTPEDLEFLGAVARQASVAIENAFLYEELAGQERMKHELAIARRIQLGSLPQTTPDIRGLDIAGISIPAHEVGGDYFDYLNGTPSHLTVIVGDVSGKGTSAALYMSRVQGILRSLQGFDLSLRELFIRANDLLRRDMERNAFITAIGAAFDTKKKRLTVVRAGHLPMFRFNSRTKKAEKVSPAGLGLGLSADRIFAGELEERSIAYRNGDVFVFVTDGVTEGRQTENDEFGEERLLNIIERTAGNTAATIRDRVIDEVKTFAGNANQHDDQTVVVVKTFTTRGQKAERRK